MTSRLIELAGLVRGDRVLDVAAGYGEPGLTAAGIVGDEGSVVLSDISDEMLDVAEERASELGIDNVEIVRGDAETLDLEPESFDAVLSRAGLMFLPDVAGTLARLHGLLKPRGRLAASVWGPPEQVQFALPAKIIMERLGIDPPPPGTPGIFGLADASRLEELVREAGFEDVGTGTTTVVYETASPDDMTRWVRDLAPPVTALLEGQSDEVVDSIWAQVTEAWAPLSTADGRVRTENQAIWVAGTKL